ncbi:DNA polymerase alpha subunit B [Sarcoptes scabiei]|uniref:DNA polymerase alpha subunit B n=1 Tax=Sarcoptes scabiei TaxID=52283 RepID=A0A132AB94_SARSC|nr:DNA polymerase alpha subunit B [Sarcoptes scabiei]KPM08228.1 DNA polymerase alpha subunit B-like protein [Sarcoptes scabiei]UXI16686.1 Sodium-dependent nutrient amino acid transporter 1 [Sarcoptes scabiei]
MESDNASSISLDENISDSNEVDDFTNCFNCDNDEIKDEDYLNQVPELSRVILYAGDSLDDNQWMRKRIKSDFGIDYLDPNTSIRKAFKFISSKLIEANENLNIYLENFIEELKNSCQKILDDCEGNTDSDSLKVIKDLAHDDCWISTSYHRKTAVETYYVGRIRFRMANHKSNSQTIYLEAPSSVDKEGIIPLDLSQFKNQSKNQDFEEFSLFPGKIVVLKGQNFSGNHLVVSKFINFNRFLRPLFPLQCPQILQEQEPFNIVCACGPFLKIDDNNQIDFLDTFWMKSIANYLKRYNPDVLFLLGPFIEESMLSSLERWSRQNLMLNENLYPYQWNLDRLFNYQIRFLCKELEGLSVLTRIVLIPSSNELGKINVFPMYPLEVKCQKSVISFSNPSILNIGGVAMGLTTTDILLHLSRNEIHNIDPTHHKSGERIRRLCEYVLSHRNFYPLLPPDLNLNLEYSKYNALLMRQTPHILVLSSVLRPFIYNIDGTIVINPGKVAKNCIARIILEPLKSTQQYTGSLSQFTNVEIIKLNY